MSPVTRAGHAVGRGAADRREARRAATAQLASEQLDTQAAGALGAEHAAAHRTLDEHRSLEREARTIDRRLAGYDESHVSNRAMGTPAPTPTEEQAALLARRREISERLNAPAMRTAGHVVAQGGRSTARTGTPVAPADLAEYRRTRARDANGGLPVDHERNLRAAGVDPDHYRQASPEERAAMRGRAEEQLQRERALLAAAGDLPDTPPKPRELRLDPAALRTRTRAERDRIRAERVQRRTRSTGRSR